jgi:hypothetical protein
MGKRFSLVPTGSAISAATLVEVELVLKEHVVVYGR